ncbi:MAG TPA: hypothetical protein VFM73_05890 [Xanthomonadaceae bacterium]|nr:hypothetical protein [Xanthomonadaceae bacterium]
MTTSSPPYHGTDGGSSGSRKVRDDVHKTVDDARQGAAGRVEGIAGSIDAAAAHLSQEDMTRLSGYVHDMAQSLTGFSRDLREKSGDEMLRDIKQLAHRNPALFLGGSVAIGFGLSRFARSTRSRERHMPVPLDQARADVPPTPSGTASPSSPDHGDLP